MSVTFRRLCLRLLVVVSTFSSGRALAWNQSARDEFAVCKGVDQSCGHQWFIDRAIAILAARGWNRFSLEEVGYIKYGAELADHPWLGPPEAPDSQLSSILDAFVPVGEPKMVYLDAKSSAGVVDAMVVDGWLRQSNPYFAVVYGADYLISNPLVNLKVAGDQQFHFPNGELTLQPVTQLFPEESGLQGIVVFDNGGVSAQSYGAVLYQVARSFWPSTPLTPSLSRLPKRSDTGRGVLRMKSLGFDLHVRLLTTYLGANPFLCAGGQEPDLCASGSPTWPVFLPVPFSLSQLQDPTPSKSRRAALVYAGWAAHMIQDLEMPWHAMNWSGRQHQAFEDQADRLILSGGIPASTFSSIADELNVFGARADYCKNVADLGAETLPTGSAPYMDEASEKPVRAGFDAAQSTAMDEVYDGSSKSARSWVKVLSDVKKSAPDAYVVAAVRRSVRDTVALLSCLDGGVYDGVDGIYVAELVAAFSGL